VRDSFGNTHKLGLTTSFSFIDDRKVDTQHTIERDWGDFTHLLAGEKTGLFKSSKVQLTPPTNSEQVMAIAEKKELIKSTLFFIY